MNCIATHSAHRSNAKMFYISTVFDCALLIIYLSRSATTLELDDTTMYAECTFEIASIQMLKSITEKNGFYLKVFRSFMWKTLYNVYCIVYTYRIVALPHNFYVAELLPNCIHSSNCFLFYSRPSNALFASKAKEFYSLLFVRQFRRLSWNDGTSFLFFTIIFIIMKTRRMEQMFK